jgi:hypothetical protein
VIKKFVTVDVTSGSSDDVKLGVDVAKAGLRRDDVGCYSFLDLGEKKNLFFVTFVRLNRSLREKKLNKKLLNRKV